MKKLIAFFALALLTSLSMAQNDRPSQISVEGKSSVKVVPEELYFNVNLGVKDESYTRCADMAVEKMANIRKLLKKNGIDEDLIKANGYSIREIQKYDPELRQAVSDGYEANIPLTIRTRRDYRKNDKIFELIKDNLESNFNLNFALSDEQTDAVKEKLITLAVKDARQKAEWIAKASGTSLGKIANIQYGEPRLIGAYGNTQDLKLSGVLSMTREASAQITEVLSPDEIEMQTSIIISWEIVQQ